MIIVESVQLENIEFSANYLHSIEQRMLAVEAAAIEARARALGTNPNLVTLVQAEKWNGVLPTTMVPGSAVPFVSVK
jgi:hypothetical protein